MKKPLLFIAAFTISHSAFSQQTKAPLKPADVYRISTLSDAHISPDGKWVVYGLSDVDTAKDQRGSHLWVQSWDGKQSVQLTYGEEAASTARWSPDGKYISFLSSRESKKGS